MISDDIRTYLPQYLSEERVEALLKDLDSFPGNLGSIYSPNSRWAEILQGDCICDLTTVALPSPKIQFEKGVVISNTCDIDLNNSRRLDMNLVHSTLLNLDKLESILNKTYPDDHLGVAAYIDNIRNQKVTNVFYFPRGAHNKLDYDSVILFDRAINIPNSSVSRENLTESRLFSLSNYGFYVFLLKLSIHFTRAREEIDRDIPEPALN